MNELCVAEGLPKPSYIAEGSDFWIEFRKDIYYSEYLQTLGLNDRQVKAVLYAKNKGKITNKEYQELFEVAQRTATRDLTDLVGREILRSTDVKGAGSYYELSHN